MSTTRDPGDPGQARQRRRRRVIAIAGVVLLAAVVSGTAMSRGDDDATSHLTVTWNGSEGHPPCRYDPQGHVVEAKLTIDGKAPRATKVTMTVTAHADENTSQPVGVSTRSVQVEGTVHLPLLIMIPVDGVPFVDEDGVAACALAVRQEATTGAGQP